MWESNLFQTIPLIKFMADYVIKEPKYNWLEITINNEISVPEDAQ